MIGFVIYYFDSVSISCWLRTFTETREIARYLLYILLHFQLVPLIAMHAPSQPPLAIPSAPLVNVSLHPSKIVHQTRDKDVQVTMLDLIQKYSVVLVCYYLQIYIYI